MVYLGIQTRDHSMVGADESTELSFAVRFVFIFVQTGDDDTFNRFFKFCPVHYYCHGHQNQCDQIGQFLEFHGNKLYYKSSPNVW